MGSRLLCCVALCLLRAGECWAPCESTRYAFAIPEIYPQLLSVFSPTGLVDSGVIQTPKYLIKSRKQQMTLRCSPVSGHLSVFWYQQALGQGPQFLLQYYNMEEREKGNISDRFSGQQFRDNDSELKLLSLELKDSALYLCASSEDTALHNQQPPV